MSDLIAPFLKQCPTQLRDKNWLQVAFRFSPSLPVLYMLSFPWTAAILYGFGLSKPSKLLHASKGVPFSRMHIYAGLLPVFKTTKYSVNLANFILMPVLKPTHVSLSLTIFSFLNQTRSAEVWGVCFPRFTIPKQENLKECPTGWDLIAKTTK